MDVEQQKLHQVAKHVGGRELLRRQVGGCRLCRSGPLFARKLDREQVPNKERNVGGPELNVAVTTGETGNEGYLFLKRAPGLHITPDARQYPIAKQRAAVL